MAAPDPDAPIDSTRSLHTPYGEQDENGTDLSLIRALLRLPPLERLRRGDAATTDALLGWVEPLGDYDALLKHAEEYVLGTLPRRFHSPTRSA